LFESLANPNNNIFLAGFTDKVALFSDFSHDPLDLAGKLRTAMGTPLYGPRALFSAIIWACQTKLSTLPGRRALLLVGDGLDNASNTGIATAVKAALQSDTTIYVISLVPANPWLKGDARPLKSDAEKNLKELAGKTGGNIISIVSKSEMEAAFLQVSKELRSQYALGYNSTNLTKDGKLRKVEIRVTPKGLRVVSREGYYASVN
jgi:VWFA-related protein